MSRRHLRPIYLIFILILAMLACNMPGANEAEPPVPLEPAVDATKLALEILATNNASASPDVVDLTKVVLEIQATGASAEQTRQASLPSVTPQLPAPTQSQPTAEAPQVAQPATVPTQDFKTRMKTARILVYEDTPRIGLWISDALNNLGLNYTFVGDASGTLMENLNSPIDWDLIIIGAESKTDVQGEFWDVIGEKISRDNAALIAEIWYLDRLGEGKIKPVLANCGIQFQRDWPLAESIYWLDSNHPLFSDPNYAMPLINYSRYWQYQAGDLIRLAPGSNATLLAGTFQKRKSDYGVLATCLDGRVIFQTFSNHDFHQDEIIRLWQNYITYTLKNRFAVKP